MTYIVSGGALNSTHWLTPPICNMADVFTVYPTATPTPRAYEYVIATGCVSALLILMLGTMFLLMYLLYYQHRKSEDAMYRHEPPQRHAAPYMVGEGRAPPTSTSFTSASSKSTVMTAAQFGSMHGMTAAQFGTSQYGASQYGGSQSSLSIKQPTISHSVV